MACGAARTRASNERGDGRLDAMIDAHPPRGRAGAWMFGRQVANDKPAASVDRACPFARDAVTSGTMPLPSQGPSGEWLRNGPPKAQPARKRSGTGTAAPDGLWRATPQGSTEGCGAGNRCPISQVTGQRGGGFARIRRLFFVVPEMRYQWASARRSTRPTSPPARRMVDFGGWDMPVNYGSQIEEHHAVRRDAGMFDVSHMCVVDLRGAARARLPAPPARERRRKARRSRARRSTPACSATTAASSTT